jgi:hypothetical protein
VNADGLVKDIALVMILNMRRKNNENKKHNFSKY